MSQPTIKGNAEEIINLKREMQRICSEVTKNKMKMEILFMYSEREIPLAQAIALFKTVSCRTHAVITKAIFRMESGECLEDVLRDAEEELNGHC